MRRSCSPSHIPATRTFHLTLIVLLLEADHMPALRVGMVSPFTSTIQSAAKWPSQAHLTAVAGPHQARAVQGCRGTPLPARAGSAQRDATTRGAGSPPSVAQTTESRYHRCWRTR